MRNTKLRKQLKDHGYRKEIIIKILNWYLAPNKENRKPNPKPIRAV